jgi:hypothetical protein
MTLLKVLGRSASGGGRVSVVGFLMAIRIEEKGEGFENGKNCFGMSSSAFNLNLSSNH